jgi:hypothetical protein
MLAMNSFSSTYVITIEIVSSSKPHVEVYSIQHYVIQFVSGFLQIIKFPLPTKLTSTITRRVLLVGQELEDTLPDHLSLRPALLGFVFLNIKFFV